MPDRRRPPADIALPARSAAWRSLAVLPPRGAARRDGSALPLPQLPHVGASRPHGVLAGPGPRPARQSGIALLEALIAIVILGIGLLGMIGLQARAYAALSDASMRAEATMAAEKLLGVMNTDIPNLASYNLAENAAPNSFLAPWVQETRRAIPGARLSVQVVDQTLQSQVNIGISWQRKAAGEQNRHVVTAYIAN